MKYSRVPGSVFYLTFLETITAPGTLSKENVRGWRYGSEVKAFGALVEDLSSAPNTHNAAHSCL